MKKAIVLLSGGIDSATTLYIAKKRGFKPLSLIFDYGQKHRKEIKHALRIAKKAKSPYRVIDLELPKNASSLLDKKLAVPSGRTPGAIKLKIPSTYVPARNLIFLSMAAAFAESMKASAIFIGAHTEDYSGYPDCRGGFLKLFKKAMTSGMRSGKNIKILAPLLAKNKTEIIKKAIRLKVPLEHTRSCYNGGKEPCGVCDSCVFRNRAFRNIGMKDPAAC